MSANVESMFYTGQEPWHKFGVKLDNPATSEEAIVAAGLDWNVSVCDLGHKDSKGKWHKITEQFATVRTDKMVPLGIVGRLYTPIQNHEAFSFFDAVVGEKKAIYHVAGALGKGETVWILVKLPDDIRIIGTDDIINKYLLLVNSHQALMALRMFFTPIRVVCQNTLSTAMNIRKNSEGIALRHFPDIHNKVEQAKKTLGIAMNYYKELSEAFNALARVKIKEDWLDNYLTLVMPVQDKGVASTRMLNIRAGMKDCFSSASNNLPGIKGTAWAAYNSVTEYVDHFRETPKLEKEQTRKLHSIWLGSGAIIKEKAFHIALDLIK
jgi:phage/plasmid-like protein (TIGR03299 family)